MAPPTTSASQRVAQLLGVTEAELKAARTAETTLSAGLSGTAPKERLALAARRLGISPAELKFLRKALNGRTDNPKRAAMLVRTVTRTASSTSAPPAPGPKPSAPKRPAQPPPRTVAAKDSANTAATKSKSPKAAGPSSQRATSAYVTKWGNVVHLFWDCHSARGFRHTGEPDADIYKVTVNDPCCRGRRVCASCRNNSTVMGAKIEQLLRSVHGPAFDERDWERFGWSRPVPRGEPINRRR